MTIPLITLDDLAGLQFLTPDLDFTDAERKAVLLAAGSSDVNAAPGSGKTTVLAAKLLLLARKWPHDTRGICVLSHTNVAREEIQRRLGATAVGARLLAYSTDSTTSRFAVDPSRRSAPGSRATPSSRHPDERCWTIGLPTLSSPRVMADVLSVCGRFLTSRLNCVLAASPCTHARPTRSGPSCWCSVQRTRPTSKGCAMGLSFSGASAMSVKT